MTLPPASNQEAPSWGDCAVAEGRPKRKLWQAGTEMAAPLYSERQQAPCATAAMSADGSMATLALGPAGQHDGNYTTGKEYSRGRARWGAHLRRCLKLRQGASPLRPPAPFPSDSMIRGSLALSRVRYAGWDAPPLTAPTFPKRNLTKMRERGPLCKRPWLSSRWSSDLMRVAVPALHSALLARMRRCLKLRQGASPLRPQPEA